MKEVGPSRVRKREEKSLYLGNWQKKKEEKGKQSGERERREKKKNKGWPLWSLKKEKKRALKRRKKLVVYGVIFLVGGTRNSPGLSLCPLCTFLELEVAPSTCNGVLL